MSVVRGVDPSGLEVFAASLDHGANPRDVVRAAGLDPGPVLDVAGTGPDDVVITFAVRGRTDLGSPGVGPVPRDADLVVAPGEEPRVFRRIAAYAVVRSIRGLLLAQLSASTNSPGRWGPCGGGLDPGEEPAAAAVREVWEESGQRVTLAGIVDVLSGHWVGRAPNGRLEDYHAVRIMYDAWCADPTDPVVHDVGGTTERSAWVTPEEAERLPLASTWATWLPAHLARA